MMDASCAVLRARYVVDREFTPVDNGALCIQDGLIAEVGRADDFSGRQMHDLGDAVLLPGLVNAHTHLEFGFAAGKVPPSPDFPDWLRRLVEEAGTHAGDEQVHDQSVEQGLYESTAAGTTLIGDITHQPVRTRSIMARSAHRPAVVSFGEVIAFGAIRDLAAERIAAACDTAYARDDLGIGLSPHAPYSVEPNVLTTCVERARAANLPLCVHAAETPAEQQYTTELTGPFRDYFISLGVWDDAIPCVGRGPIEYLHDCGALGPGTLLAHVNYPSHEDLDLLCATGTSVAYCPRTHDAFGHEPHRFREMLARGINVCLGTDSLASVPSLSILDEMRFLRRRYEDLPARTILAMATCNGARALRRGESTGLLEPGRRADCVAVALDPHGPADPLDNVLGGEAPCHLVLIAGQRVVG